MKTIVGQVTDLQIFGSELTDRQMKAFTSCEQFLKGDLLSWDEITWELAGRRHVSEYFTKHAVLLQSYITIYMEFYSKYTI